MIMEPQELLRELADSFSNSQYPGDDRIIDVSSPLDLERRQIAEAFQGWTWSAVPFEVLIENRAALAFFTPDAFRYYLPAFIVAAVSLYEEADTLPADLVSSLTPPAEGDMTTLQKLFSQGPGPGAQAPSEEIKQILDSLGEFQHSGQAWRQFVSRVSGLNPTQARSVRHFLEYMRDIHAEDFPVFGPASALERFWSRF